MDFKTKEYHERIRVAKELYEENLNDPAFLAQQLEIEEEYDALREAAEASEQAWEKKNPLNPMGKSYKEFEDFWYRRHNAAPENKKADELLELLRRTQVHTELETQPDYGDVMYRETFISYCEMGALIDNDGYGSYMYDELITNLSVRPSDIKNNVYRFEFDKVIWFNK